MISFDFLKRRSLGPQKLVTESGHKYSVLEPSKKSNTVFNLKIKADDLFRKKMSN